MSDTFYEVLVTLNLCISVNVHKQLKILICCFMYDHIIFILLLLFVFDNFDNVFHSANRV